ncbi:MAG: DUF1697 domain-containing protein [Planctomycetota bacterium]
MTTWIALLRGINVGGKNRMPMAQLRAALGAAGLAEVRTYIQSGNVVFESPGRQAAPLRETIRKALGKEFGFTPPIALVTAPAFQKLLDGNPFDVPREQGKEVHLFLPLDSWPRFSLAPLEALATETETLHQGKGVLYLHAPDGVGRSKLVARIDSLLPGPCTARNLRSCFEIADLAAGR